MADSNTVVSVVPLFIFILINTITCLFIFYVTYQLRKREKVLTLVIVYPLVYNFSFIFAIINRLYSIFRIKQNKEQSFPLWVAHSVADPSHIIINALLAIFMLSFTRKAVKNVTAIGERKPLIPHN